MRETRRDESKEIAERRRRRGEWAGLGGACDEIVRSVQYVCTQRRVHAHVGRYAEARSAHLLCLPTLLTDDFSRLDNTQDRRRLYFAAPGERRERGSHSSTLLYRASVAIGHTYTCTYVHTYVLRCLVARLLFFNMGDLGGGVRRHPTRWHCHVLAPGPPLFTGDWGSACLDDDVSRLLLLPYLPKALGTVDARCKVPPDRSRYPPRGHAFALHRYIHTWP